MAISAGGRPIRSSLSLLKTPTTPFAALERLLPIVMGEEDATPLRIHERLSKERPDEDLMAKAAINVALMDLEGKRRGVPVAELLGEVIRQSMPVSHPLNNGTADDDIPVIDEALKQGYFHFMLKMGMPEYSAAGEIERVAKLHEYYGDRIRIKVDANTGWTLEQAFEFLQGVGPHVIFVEQPVGKYDIDGMTKLQAGTDLQISADESLAGVTSARAIIAKKAARGFSLKISKNGGILGAQEIARLAERRRDHAGCVTSPHRDSIQSYQHRRCLQVCAATGRRCDQFPYLYSRRRG